MLSVNLTDNPYSTTRNTVIGKNWAVATSQALASAAGMEMIVSGGNAVDAAVASAIALTVVEPTSNGIGGDAFALIWDGGQLHGLNASGRSGAAIPSVESISTIPELGWLTVTVPGAVSAWRGLWQRWGKLPFEQLFEPAIRYAQQGYGVSPVTAKAWGRAERVYLPLNQPQYLPFQQVFFPQGRAPRVGEVWRSPLHAETLHSIAASGGESFYRGELGTKIVDWAKQTGGYLTKDDLSSHQAEWVQPISTTYRGVDVWEIPPNGQGIAALIALNILENFDLDRRESDSTYHRQIEAMKLAFADLNQYVGDRAAMQIRVEQLLDKAYSQQRSGLIGERAIATAQPGFGGGTVYLATADDTLMVSMIQSNYEGFGSGILVPDTGIALHNRGYGFTLQKDHPNQIAPRKRPLHTIIPGFLSQGGKAIGPFGVMGGQMQPQGHLQVVSNLVDFGMNPQAALDAPRWRFIQGKQVLLESQVSREIAAALNSRGHHIEIAPPWMFGKGQIILRQNGVLLAASESRADGLAIIG